MAKVLLPPGWLIKCRPVPLPSKCFLGIGAGRRLLMNVSVSMAFFGYQLLATCR